MIELFYKNIAHVDFVCVRRCSKVVFSDLDRQVSVFSTNHKVWTAK